MSSVQSIIVKSSNATFSISIWRMYSPLSKQFNTRLVVFTFYRNENELSQPDRESSSARSSDSSRVFRLHPGNHDGSRCSFIFGVPSSLSLALSIHSSPARSRANEQAVVSNECTHIVTRDLHKRLDNNCAQETDN